jgi:hypothetical protein
VVNNDSIWWGMIKEMAEKDFRLRVTNYNEVVDYFNRKTGINMTPLFAQYVKHYRLPRLVYSTRKKRKKMITTIRWEADVTDFSMPISYMADGQKTFALITTSSKKIQSVSPLEFDSKHFYYELKKVVRDKRHQHE